MPHKKWLCSPFIIQYSPHHQSDGLSKAAHSLLVALSLELDLPHERENSRGSKHCLQQGHGFFVVAQERLHQCLLGLGLVEARVTELGGSSDVEGSHGVVLQQEIQLTLKISMNKKKPCHIKFLSKILLYWLLQRTYNTTHVHCTVDCEIFVVKKFSSTIFSDEN